MIIMCKKQKKFFRLIFHRGHLKTSKLTFFHISTGLWVFSFRNKKGQSIQIIVDDWDI